MSFVRRLAVGVPLAGATAFAALTIASPVLAAADTHPVVMASPDRGNAGYGSEAPTTAPTTAPAVAGTTTPPAVTATTVPAAPVTGGTRGHAGYPSTPSSESPAPLPSGSVQSVPSTGVSDNSVPKPQGGIKGGSLPLTGGPVGATVGVGAVLVAGGVGALWYTRRRKTA